LWLALELQRGRSFLVFRQFLLISSGDLRTRDFNVATVRLSATSPFSRNMDWPIILCRLSEHFRFLFRRTKPDRRPRAPKIEHDLRRARFAGIQRHRPYFVETHTDRHHPT